MQDVLPSSIEATQTDVEYDAPSSTPPLKRVKTTVTSTKTTPLVLSTEITTEFSPKSGNMGLPPSNLSMASPDDSVKTTVGEKIPALVPEPTEPTNSDEENHLAPSHPVIESPEHDITTSVGKTQIIQEPGSPILDNNAGTDSTSMQISTGPPAVPKRPSWTSGPNPWAPPTGSDQQSTQIITQTNEEDRMETESNKTIESTPPSPKLLHEPLPTAGKLAEPRKLYSKAHTRRKMETHPEWCTGTLKVKARQRLRHFDPTEWPYERIIAAFDVTEELEKFLKHKLTTHPTVLNIPAAINSKLKYFDTAFFRSFSRTKDTQPAHQIEFNALYQMALEKYKRQHGKNFINKNNRDQIYSKLRTKLAIDFMTNADFLLIRPHDCARLIYYCLNFAQIKPVISFEKTRSHLSSIHVELLEPLPTSPQLIDHAIHKALPYAIPIQNRINTGSVITALRKIFSFERLPDNYFAHALKDIPENYRDLYHSFQGIFPITEHKELARLSTIRRQLKQHYIFDRIPDSYFDLPKEKERLPSTPQDLNSATRHLFPCAPKTEEEFKNLVTTLREHYSFKRIPKDFFIQKSTLPTDPKDIRTKGSYNFPINDVTIAKVFLAEIESEYKFGIPLPLEYMIVNPTDKPNLPADPTLVTAVHITTPIRSPKILVETARALRAHYFFHKIPPTWIEIPEKVLQQGDKPALPMDLPGAINTFKQISQLNELQLPVRTYEQIQPTESLLHNYFSFNTLPLHFISVPDLPTPEWDILDNYAPHTSVTATQTDHLMDHE